MKKLTRVLSIALFSSLFAAAACKGKTTTDRNNPKPVEPQTSGETTTAPSANTPSANTPTPPPAPSTGTPSANLPSVNTPSANTPTPPPANAPSANAPSANAPSANPPANMPTPGTPPANAVTAPMAATGIAECDQYAAAFEKYNACDKVPQAAKDAAKQTIDNMRQGWLQLKSSNAPAAAKQASADSCKTAMAALQQSAASQDCQL